MCLYVCVCLCRCQCYCVVLLWTPSLFLVYSERAHRVSNCIANQSWPVQTKDNEDKDCEDYDCCCCCCGSIELRPSKWARSSNIVHCNWVRWKRHLLTSHNSNWIDGDSDGGGGLVQGHRHPNRGGHATVAGAPGEHASKCCVVCVCLFSTAITSASSTAADSDADAAQA